MTASLDQFFTPQMTALRCWAWLLAQPGVVTPDRFYIEPSAGTGAFLRLLPMGWRAGYEIDEQLVAASLHDVDMPPVVNKDYLTLHKSAHVPDGFVAVGNPPFGFRGDAALAFINHSFALGAEYVAFILPAAFKPELGGAPPVIEKRIKGGYSIAHLPVDDAFVLPDGGGKEITGCAFVLYKKGTRPKAVAAELTKLPFTLYNIGSANKKAGYCEWGMDKIERCARFLPVARRHGQPIKASPTKDYTSVIGIETDDPELLRRIDELDWASFARQSTNRNQCLNQARVRHALENADFVSGSICAKI